MQASEDTTFQDVVQGLRHGDFTRLTHVFQANRSDAARQPPIIKWCEEGRFESEPQLLEESLTCACFLGESDVAEYLLKRGVDPSGGSGTGLNAFHWAVNRGQLEAVRLLLKWKAPLEARSMYGGNVVDTAIWSAVNEPRPGQREIVEELLKAGARLHDEKSPTGNEELDAILRRHAAI
jgi:ankyrin repeat protein